MTDDAQARQIWDDTALANRGVRPIDMHRAYASAIAQSRREGFEMAKAAARDVADERSIACDKAAKAYAVSKPDDPYWAVSERCAEREATSISIAIASLTYPEGE
jgi:hypothetical protein